MQCVYKNTIETLPFPEQNVQGAVLIGYNRKIYTRLHKSNQELHYLGQKQHKSHPVQPRPFNSSAQQIYKG